FAALRVRKGGKERLALDVGQKARVGTISAGAYVGDEGGSRRGAVAFPQLAPTGTVVGCEESRAVHVRDVLRVGAIDPSRRYIFYALGTRARAIAFPQVEACLPIPRGEEQGAVYVGEPVGVRAGTSRQDVLNQNSSGLSTVAFPQLVSSHVV